MNGFHEFWLRNTGRLEKYLASLPYRFTLDEIHDGAQDAFDWLQSRWSPEADDEDLQRRLKCVARGRALDSRRRRQTLDRLMRLYAAVDVDVVTGPDVVVEALDERRRLREAWNLLSERDRELLTAYYLHGKSYEVLAAETGSTQVALRKMVSRSVANARRVLQGVAGAIAVGCVRAFRKGAPAAIAIAPAAMHAMMLAIAITSLATSPLPTIHGPLGPETALVEAESEPEPRHGVVTVPALPRQADLPTPRAEQAPPLRPKLALSVPLDPPKPPKHIAPPCLTKECKAEGDALVLTVAPGVEEEVSQPYVEMCEHMPVPTSPGDPVYCRDGH